MKLLFILFFSAVTLSSGLTNLSKEGEKNLKKALRGLFSQHKIQLEKLNLDGDTITDNDILNADGKWFAVKEENTTIAWLMADKIWGRYHEFEYMMVTDTSLNIIDITILNYPESHGKAVTDKNWLINFNGFSPTRIPVFRKDIDALSGATISSGSLSENIGKSLLLLGKLHRNQLLN